MKPLTCLKIDQKFISIFASGNSINDLTEEDISFIKEKSFLITVNYAPQKIIGHMNIHSDKIVSNFLSDLYRSKKKDTLLLSRMKAFTNNKDNFLKDSIDYWFDEKSENLKGNYTLVWLLQLMEKHFSDKKILVFGLDLMPQGDIAKWYDQHTDFDKNKRGPKYPVQRKLDQCSQQIDKFLNKKEIFINCSPITRYENFEKNTNYREILNVL